MEIQILEIDSKSNLKSKYLTTVQDLWRKNSQTLGFMPEGGFLDYADKGQILVAIHLQQECVGYLMYRVSNYTAHIVHLCTDINWRRKGVARKLVKYLIDKTKKQNLYGIKFSCRRDYDLNPMWSSFHFVPKDEKIGKSKKQELLTIWGFEHDCPELLKILIKQKLESKLKAVIDANIFFDLQTDDSDSESTESKYLLVDWLQEEVELCLTDEIYTEIDRNNDANKRDIHRKYTAKFTILPFRSSDLEKIYTSLSKIFPDPQTIQDKSDLRQLSRAIASDAQVFITRDRVILELESKIYDEFNIQVLRPTDFIIKLDQLIRASEYQPVRLAGTIIEKRRVNQGEQDKIINQFLMYNKQEKKSLFQRNLQKYLGDPNIYRCFVIQYKTTQFGLNLDENFIALFVYKLDNLKQLEIPLIRFKKNNVTKVILRHLLLEFIVTSCDKNMIFTKITDEYLDDFIIEAIQEDLFVKEENIWIKPNLVFSGTARDLSKRLKECKSSVRTLDNNLSELRDRLSNNSQINPELTIFLERFLYPAKIIDADIPSFIVPIQPRWAEHLFDTHLANQGLFGAREDLAFKRELVYYRSKLNSGGLCSPSRILWYVSQSKNYSETGCLRACSIIDEIIIDNPKEIYRRFRRFGVYSFQDVLEVAKGDINQKIMVIRFRDTELFKTPIYLKKIQKILNKKSLFPSPYKIDKMCFKMLYNIGINYVDY